MAQNVNKIQKVDTGLNADSTEWCPYPELQHILLCGTYKLKESQNDSTNDQSSNSTENSSQAVQNDSETVPEVQVRNGGVIVYSLSYEEGVAKLNKSSSIDLCGILDIKWMNNISDEAAFFGVVDAEGHFQLLKLDDSHVEPVLKEHLSDKSLGLSLGWAPQQSPHRVTVSDSAGCITVFDLSSSKASVVSTWNAHGYEAWITAFHNTDANILYSGGDDCRLKRWDLRDTTSATFTSRRHTMGVCSVESHPWKSHILATGSYDEELIVWDDRNMRQPLTSANLGGGVWRIKWDPFSGENILTATMYNGTHIIDASNLGLPALPVVAEYTDHNLAYGADWCRLTSDGRQRCRKLSPLESDSENNSHNSSTDDKSDNIYLISTCSFYDHALHLWTWENKPCD